jgi:hypothetical protein
MANVRGNKVLIKSLRVDDGFLADLEIGFDSDLNVLIGGRGVGKTAVIELIRFCLGAPNLDSDLAKESLRHALGVLQDGVATLTVVQNGVEKIVSRTANDKSPRDASLGPLPIILSQREIETLARTPRGRLNLLDSFFSPISTINKVAVSRIRAISAELRDICGEIDEVEEQLQSRPNIEKEISELKARQLALGSKTKERATKLVQLDGYQKQVNQLSVIEHAFTRARDGLLRWINGLPVGSESRPLLEPWPADADPIGHIRRALQADANDLREIAARARGYLQEVEERISVVQLQRVPIEDQLRKGRQQLELDQEGSGKLAKEISRLEEERARHESLTQSLTAKRDQASKAHASRMEELGRLAEEREELFERRKAVAQSLNQSLYPKVKIDVYHSTDIALYESTLLETLRGSYLRYAEIAPIIAREVSPIELCEIVFFRDSKRLSDLIGISEDRSSRLIAALREGRLEDVLVAPLFDSVEFFLLDGAGLKHIDELSIGQRCTVVLSVVFENTNVVLLVDQPEDHLDNEFVVETLIKSIRNRSLLAQTIITTHNANIPVLGNAAQVIHLDSNGERGFVKNAGHLRDVDIVESILSVMEGGDDAFRRRADFYEVVP